MKDNTPRDDKAANDKPPADKRQAKSSSRDITPVLKGWEYESGTINVRKVSGIDGSLKLQMRLDLGLLQMEVTGRPDGDRPFGAESLLDHFQQQLAEHLRETGSEAGFALDADQCQSLREEAVLYYHRYVSLFVLEDFEGVVRDTARNLRVIDFCREHAEDEQDRLMLEQYRPYLTMMLVRAQGSVLMQEQKYAQTLKMIEDGLQSIRDFYERFGQEEAYERSNEVRVLKRFAREVQKKLPVDPIQRMQRRLDRAVKEERYEDAAKLRDEMNIYRRTKKSEPVPQQSES